MPCRYNERIGAPLLGPNPASHAVWWVVLGIWVVLLLFVGSELLTDAVERLRRRAAAARAGPGAGEPWASVVDPAAAEVSGAPLEPGRAGAASRSGGRHPARRVPHEEPAAEHRRPDEPPLLNLRARRRDLARRLHPIRPVRRTWSQGRVNEPEDDD